MKFNIKMDEVFKNFENQTRKEQDIKKILIKIKM